MKWHVFFPLPALVLGWFAIADAEEKAASAAAVSASGLTVEQFKALSPDAVIEVDGERMTKREFIQGRTKALEQVITNMLETRAKSEAEFEARRKALLDAEKAKLDEANKKVETEIARLVAADAAAHGPNWEARKKQAAALLKEAATVPPGQRSQLEKRASDLLSSVNPQQ